VSNIPALTTDFAPQADKPLWASYRLCQAPNDLNRSFFHFFYQNNTQNTQINASFAPAGNIAVGKFSYLPLLIANRSLIIKKGLCMVWIALCAALLSCASTGGSGEALSLDEAIEQSAEKIAADLPAGSRVVIAAWESPSLGLSDYIMEELTGALFDRDIEVADRQNLEYVYKELNLQRRGEVSDESARSIGKFLGAGLVITGQFTELGGPYRYRTNAVNVETATRDSVSRIDVKGDAALRRMIAALASQKTAVKTASYGEGEKAAPKTASYRKSGSSAPKTAGAFLDRGILFYKRGDYETAIEDFTEVLKLNPDYAAAYFNRGVAYNDKKDYDRAIADYTQAIRLDPDLAPAYNNRGAAYNDKKDYDRAIADFTQAIRLDPDLAPAYTGRGIAYVGKKDYDRAIADYTQAIRLDPDYAIAYSGRGAAYFFKGDYKRTRADFEKALQLAPNNSAVRDNLQDLLELLRKMGY
jgi:tetratricopeptide (TPR) repeat protein